MGRSGYWFSNSKAACITPLFLCCPKPRADTDPSASSPSSIYQAHWKYSIPNDAFQSDKQRHGCLIQAALPAARQNPASAAVQFFAPYKCQCLGRGEEGKTKAKSRQAWQPKKYSHMKTSSRKKKQEKKSRKTSQQKEGVLWMSPLTPHCPLGTLFLCSPNSTELHTEDSPCPPSLPPQPSAQRTQQPQRFKLSNNSSFTSERSNKRGSKIITAQSWVQRLPPDQPFVQQIRDCQRNSDGFHMPGKGQVRALSSLPVAHHHSWLFSLIHHKQSQSRGAAMFLQN